MSSQYHPHRLERDDLDWRAEVEARGVTPTLDRFVSVRCFSLSVPGGVALRAAVAPSRKVCASMGWP